ncbi:MAG TPA: hypothetical protein VD995_24130 [Azospirillum sp.]|nr:hypothetical protein [Azospirillum sp.]
MEYETIDGEKWQRVPSLSGGVVLIRRAPGTPGDVSLQVWVASQRPEDAELEWRWGVSCDGGDDALEVLGDEPYDGWAPDRAAAIAEAVEAADEALAYFREAPHDRSAR